MMTTMFGRLVFDDSAAVSAASGDSNRAAASVMKLFIFI
jgi:hypothetical protein